MKARGLIDNATMAPTVQPLSDSAVERIERILASLDLLPAGPGRVMTGVVLAVDIGGTKTAVGLADRDDTLLDVATAPTPASDGPQAVVRTILDLGGVLLGRSRRCPLAVRGVGIGTAGVVDVNTGSIVSSTDTMSGWTGTPLAAGARGSGDALARSAVVHVQNDVDAHALGELRHGAAVGARSALVVAVGTGVGAGIIVEGRALRGARHVAGEIGHVPTPGAEHLRCPCGRLGHLEAIGSGVGMHRHYLSIGGDPAVTDARGIVARAGRPTRSLTVRSRNRLPRWDARSRLRSRSWIPSASS